METPTHESKARTVEANQACRKDGYQKVTFEHKLFVIDQINNVKFLLTSHPRSTTFHEQQYTTG